MAFIFGKGKNQSKKQDSCSGEKCTTQTMQQAGNKGAVSTVVKVLGSGCAKCNQMEAITKQALSELGMSTEIEHVTDFVQIAAYGVMSTPALVVNEKIVIFGKVPKKAEVLDVLKKI